MTVLVGFWVPWQLIDNARSCCSTVVGKRGARVAEVASDTKPHPNRQLFLGPAYQGIVCGDMQQGDCVFRDSEEHKKILMKRWQPQRQPCTTHYSRNTVAPLSLF